MTPLLPPALRPGDTIALVAPAGPLDRDRIERAMTRLEEKDFGVKTYGDVFRTRGYLAGDDSDRAAELNEAFADSEVNAVMPARGGYGVTRLLDRLDFSPLRRQPKIITGFSDITALHSAIARHVGLVTFHSPNPQDGLGRPDGLSDLSARTFWRAVLAREYDSATSPGYEIPLTDAERQQIVAISPGIARGPIAGGNLALVAALLGTPYDFDTSGRILLIEDIDERPYRIDRCLAQLQLAGKLDDLRGVIVGQFTDCDAPADKPSLTLREIFDDYLTPLGVPIVENYPVGHDRDNATLPLGIEVELDADDGRIKLLENPVQLCY